MHTFELTGISCMIRNAATEDNDANTQNYDV